MTLPTPGGHARPAGGRHVLALASGLSIVAALAVIDIVVQPSTAVVGMVLVAPLLTALSGSPRDVMITGSAAVLLAVLSGSWNDNFSDVVYLYRVGVVAAVSVLAVLATCGRERIGRDRERFALLAAVAEIADGTRSLTDTVAAFNELVVPAVADICIVDAMSQGELQRLSVRVAGRDGDASAAMLATRPPGAIEHGDTDHPRLLEVVDDTLLEQLAHGPQDLEQLRTLGVTSGIVVPLRARGRALGSLTLLTTTHSARRYAGEELEFARVLAGRAALALDNAGLFSELETIEAQLTAALSTLAEAVTVQNAGGALLYANEAAARMLGFGTAQELVATPVHEILRRFEATNEDGTPVRLEDLPGHRVLTGDGEPEPHVVHTIDKRTGEDAWRMTKASGVYDRDGNVKLVVNVIEDITQVKRAEMTQRLLASASELLTSSLDYERTLQQVAELAVPQLADWCAVGMPDGHGFIRTVAVAHADPDKVAFARRIAERYPTPADAPSGVPQAIRDGDSQFINDIPDEMLAAVAVDEEHLELLRGVGMRAGLTVPMSAGGKNVGALSLISAESGRRFTVADVELAQELARRAGSAVENARLYTERSHIARTLQVGLLPGRLPQMPGWRVATLYRPAGDENWVGGDFYDAFAVHGGWLVLVGDVAGRGAEAAALTGLARHTLRTAAMLLDDPLDAVGTLNAELRAREHMSLCSVAAVLLREEEGRAAAEIVCAGHPLPLLARGGTIQAVGSFSPMLGAYPVEDWRRTTVELETGDVLMLYTDGVFDAVGEEGRFGEERLQRTVTGVAGAADAVARIDAALSAFERGAPSDDTAVLAVEREAVAARAVPLHHDNPRADAQQT